MNKQDEELLIEIAKHIRDRHRSMPTLWEELDDAEIKEYYLGWAREILTKVVEFLLANNQAEHPQKNIEILVLKHAPWQVLKNLALKEDKK